MRTARFVRRLRLPSPALVVACVALAIALSGVGYAAVNVPKGSVGTAQLKNNAVTSAKVKNGTLKAVDHAPGAIPAGPTVIKNVSIGASTPVTGVVGAGNDTLIRTLTVPAGRYHATAQVLVINESTSAGVNARCFLRGPAALEGGINGLFQPLQAQTGANTYRLVLALEGVATLTGPGQLKVECNKGSSGDSLAALATITAMRVGTAALRVN